MDRFTVAVAVRWFAFALHWFALVYTLRWFLVARLVCGCAHAVLHALIPRVYTHTARLLYAFTVGLFTVPGYAQLVTFWVAGYAPFGCHAAFERAAVTLLRLRSRSATPVTPVGWLFTVVLPHICVAVYVTRTFCHGYVYVDVGLRTVAAVYHLPVTHTV